MKQWINLPVAEMLWISYFNNGLLRANRSRNDSTSSVPRDYGLGGFQRGINEIKKTKRRQ